LALLQHLSFPILQGKECQQGGKAWSWAKELNIQNLEMRFSVKWKKLKVS
jgi:hypothetical protein